MYKNLLVSSVSLYHHLHNWRYWTLLFLRLLEYRWIQVNQTQIIFFRSTHIKTTKQVWPYNSKRLRATYFHSTPGARCAFPVALNRGCISLLTCPKLGYPLCSISKNGYMPYQACASTQFMYHQDHHQSIITGTHTKHNIIQYTIRMHYLTFCNNIPYWSAGKASKLTIQVSPRNWQKQ